MSKSYKDINQKIQAGTAKILTAEEMVSFVKEHGTSYAAEQIDVVTTGTFGCMCSSGAFFNLKQPDPPIKIDKIWIDGVPAYHGTAAVDFFLGVTKSVNKKKLKEYPALLHKYQNNFYGGGHVLEKLIQGKSVLLEATGASTDGYPRKQLICEVTLDDFNQAILLNPRNGYQRYNCAINPSDRVLYTYMGKLLPRCKNATFGGVGTLSPLNNDPNYKTIGLGTRIFLGGTSGFILGEGTQHDPDHQFGTVMVKGNLKEMQPPYLSGATITNYGISCFVGIGIPIPILDEDLARSCGKPDSEIFTNVVNYSTGTRDRPKLMKVSYETLKSDNLKINGRHVPLSSTSSIAISRQIAEELKLWIQMKKFLLSKPIERLSDQGFVGSLNKEDIAVE